jgi:hypothetical protein
MIPSDKYKIINRLHMEAEIIDEKYHDHSVELTAFCGNAVKSRYSVYIL